MRKADTGYQILDASLVITLWKAETFALMDSECGILYSDL